MTRRSPTNQRYTSDVAGGKTRKSAASVKPKSQAAASVKTPRKPMTEKEKKAAQKRREEEQRRRDIERIRKREAKEKAAFIAAGIEPDVEEKEEKKGFFPGMKKALDDNKQAKAREAALKEKVEARKKAMEEARAQAKASSEEAAASAREETGAPAGSEAKASVREEAKAPVREETEASAGEKAEASEGVEAITSDEPKSEASPVNRAAVAGTAAGVITTKAPTTRVTTTKTPTKKTFMGLFRVSKDDPTLPKTKQYWAYRRLYTGLVGVGLVLVVLTVVLGVIGFPINALWITSIVVGYVLLIAGFLFDHFKIKPIVQEHRRRSGSTKRSPKQIKHDLKAVQEARELEKARQAEEAAKKRMAR